MAGTGQPYYKATAGTILKYGPPTASPTLVQLSGIRKYGGLPEAKAHTWDITQIDAVLSDGTTPDMWEYKGFGKSTPGQLMFTVAGADALLTTLYSLLAVLKTYQVFFSQGATLTFVGAITGIKPSLKDKEEASWDITIDVSGAITFAAGSGAAGSTPPAHAEVTLDQKSLDVDTARAALVAAEKTFAEAQAAAAQKAEAIPLAG